MVKSLRHLVVKNQEEGATRMRSLRPCILTAYFPLSVPPNVTPSRFAIFTKLNPTPKY